MIGGNSYKISELEKFQNEKIVSIVRYAYQNNSFYRNKLDSAGIKPEDIKGINDLWKLPFTTKEELRGKPWILLAVPRRDISQIHISTGTTSGEPIYIPFTYEDLYRDIDPTYYDPFFIVEKGDIVFNALPYEMSSAGLSFHRVFQNGFGATVVPVGKGGFYSTPEKTVKLMKELGCDILITTPSYAVYLSEVAESLGINVGTDLKLKKLWLTGEGSSNSLRKRIENMWQCPALMFYGSLEGGPIGIECIRREGLHIAVWHNYVEIVDRKSGKILEPGEIGEIVITPLKARKASPLLRYKTGDLGYIEDEPCSCGSSIPRIFLRGRIEDMLFINSKEISVYFIEEFLMRIPEVGNWYQIHHDGSKLKIKIEPARGFENSISAEAISSQIEYYTGIENDVEIVPTRSIPRPRGKISRVV